MALTLLSAIFSSPSLKITNVTTGQVVLIPIRTIRVGLIFPARVAHHQMEDGNTRVDQRILMPIGINIDLIAPDADVLQQVTTVALNRSDVYRIQSRGVIVDNMRVNQQALDQGPENISSNPMRLSFTQMMFQGQGAIVFTQAADASILDRGMTFLSNAANSVSSMAGKISGLL